MEKQHQEHQKNTQIFIQNVSLTFQEKQALDEIAQFVQGFRFILFYCRSFSHTHLGALKQSVCFVFQRPSYQRC